MIGKIVKLATIGTTGYAAFSCIRKEMIIRAIARKKGLRLADARLAKQLELVKRSDFSRWTAADIRAEILHEQFSRKQNGLQ